LFPLVIIKGLVLLVSVFPGACWEPVPTGLFCIVVFLASKYFPASLNFLIYILLTFDQKKKERACPRLYVADFVNLALVCCSFPVCSYSVSSS
jgi:hypothetical protein